MSAYNSAADLFERNLAPGRSARPYLLTEGRAWSYEEVARGVDGAAAGLLDLGLRPGDRLVLAVRDRPEAVMAFWGALKAGLVAVPVFPGLTTSDLRFVLAEGEVRAVACDSSSVRSVVPLAAALGIPCLAMGEIEEGDALRWSDVCRRPDGVPTAPTERDDIALWLHTSGTTGEPKAVMHRHGNLEAAPAGLSRQVVGMGPQDVVLSVSKMFFAYGLGNTVYLPAAAGAAAVIDPGPAVPERVQGLLDRLRPTVLFAVPSFLAGFVRLPEAHLPDSVRMVLSAGETLPVELFESFWDRFGLPPLDGLGSTEALHHVTSNRLDDVVPGTAGWPLEGFEVEVLDREGRPVPASATGELWVRGPTTFAGYWGRPDLTARAYRGGWMRTGDRVHLTEGRVVHQGRLDDLMKIGGMWVAPQEVEDVLLDHPAVREAAVVAGRDQEGVTVLLACVVAPEATPGLEAELARLCRHRLASYKVPHSFRILPELPRTPTGKLRRAVLREQVAAGR